jgi:hypothetical protein
VSSEFVICSSIAPYNVGLLIVVEKLYENIYVNCVKWIRIIQVACSWRKGREDQKNQIWYVLKFDPRMASSFKNEHYGCSQNFIE